MAIKVVGAGIGRTGTMSLKIGLEKLLGAPCYHMAEVFKHLEHVPLWTDAANGNPVDWDALFDGYVATVDWPSGAYWPEISAHYPDALIVLSHRDAEKWWKSANETIFQAISNIPEEDKEWKSMIDAMMANRFTSDLTDKDACIAAYAKHNEIARATAPKHRFIEWEAKDGWGPLCKALDLPIPDEPFPHVNSTEEFVERIRARKEKEAGAAK
jgi:hypothetical protein